jgi:hypothetical protein
MSDQVWVYATASLMAALLAFDVLRRRFDPFAPVWLFFVGYFHVYVIQAISLHDWAIDIRGVDVVTAANCRAFWALLVYVAVYSCGVGKVVAACLPRPPSAWSAPAVGLFSPMLFLWGLYCAWVVIAQGWGNDAADVSPELVVFRSFPFVMLVAGNLLIVTGRHGPRPSPAMYFAGLAVVALYVLIWMFNGKRSHSLIGVLTGVCSVYITRQRRPSWPVLITTAFVGSMVVALSIGWRNARDYDRSFSGFLGFVTNFKPSAILESLNIEDGAEMEELDERFRTYETLEYGGFLLILDTVPEKSDYDYGASYIRCVSTFIPRFLWADKPLYGRDKWVSAWIAGSEFKRDEEFTGPAIGLLGAMQLNGGAVGTLIVMAAVALGHRAGYEYFIRHAAVPWAQAWWALIFYNAWMMVLNDDPMVWFYYNWGVTCMPVMVLFWVVNLFVPAPTAAPVGAEFPVADRPRNFEMAGQGGWARGY